MVHKRWIPKKKDEKKTIQNITENEKTFPLFKPKDSSLDGVSIWLFVHSTNCDELFDFFLIIAIAFDLRWGMRNSFIAHTWIKSLVYLSKLLCWSRPELRTVFKKGKKEQMWGGGGKQMDSAFTLGIGGGSGRAVTREAKGCLKQNSANGCKPRIQQSQLKFSINNHPAAVVLVNKEISIPLHSKGL